MVFTDCPSFYLMSFDVFWDPRGSPRPSPQVFDQPFYNFSHQTQDDFLSLLFSFSNGLHMKGSPVSSISLIRLGLCVCRTHNNHVICVLVLSSIALSRHLSASLITDLLSFQPIPRCILEGSYHKQETAMMWGILPHFLGKVIMADLIYIKLTLSLHCWLQL